MGKRFVNKTATDHLMHGGAMVLIGLLLLPGQAVAQSSTPLVSFTLGGTQLHGLPLLWNRGGCSVLHADGSLIQFDIDEASDVQSYRASFAALSQVELRERLQREFGNQFTVSSTPNFLVVHRPQSNQWPEVLESLHREFLRYFGTRSTPLRKGRFPMVAIVFPDRSSFLRYAETDYHRPLPPNVLGFYSTATNRIAMYDHGYRSGGVDSTIRHEAAHQSAFNGGLHSRIAPQPQWFVEGIGTMFEAEGIHDRSRNHSLASRVNRSMLTQLRQQFPDSQSLTPAIDALVGTDALFNSDPKAAYAVAWAMTFYMADRQPDAMNRFVRTFTGRTPFLRYDAASRQRDFEQIMGMSNPMLASQIIQFLASVSN